MSDKQITIQEETVSYLLSMIENRLREIGKGYQSNGRSYADDLEITGLRTFARQLGYDFDVMSVASGFAVTRVDFSEAAR
ncbi:MULTISPECIES: hypothetical protein [Pseudomonas]|jgi:hypothetical protein|uniref:hypothetical protein n=1 Tax=Pseudomonas TaxID=286 RepID=UPI0014733862|nr:MULTISPECIES: hypothetical protein [Pseudomonas]MBJ2242797.1 hypothetical protein [Pseudomonas sp. MF6768]MBK3456774.1 hypothetical protein [Pseudomonas sp. MF6754]NMZ41978.1 hypothetical protein [Pseudomonas proteolytica]